MTWLPSDIATFSGAFTWVIAHGYFLMFVAMLIEGPVVTAAAAFAVASGYFNLAAVFALSLLGDLVADVVYYAIGYWGRLALVERYGHYMGLSQARMKRLETLLHAHSVKTLIVLKLAPVLPTPGLMLVGATRMSIKRFIIISLIITLPKTIIFMAVGYYFGVAYTSFSHYLNEGLYGVAIAFALILVVYYAYTKFSSAIANRIEKV